MDARGEPIVIGRYQVLERIGRGAMGTVYRATDPLIGRTVAIKLLLVDDADLRARFLQEVRAAGTLSHPNIVAAHDFGEADGRPFIVMELVEGRSLDERLHDPVPLPWADKLRLVQQLCAALGYAHDRGVVHRDIKPANLMLDQRGDLKVVDFGIAKLGEAQLTRTGSVLGTLTYMSPEQINGDSVDRRSDIFSVGVVLYEILSSRRAFDRDTTSRLIHAILHEQPEPLTHQLAHLDPEWDRIIDTALRKDPAERYQTLAQLAADVARVGAKGEPVPMATDRATTRLLESSRSRPIASATPNRAVATRSRWTVPALVVASSLLVGVITWFAATALNKPATAPPIAATTVPPTVPPKQVVAKEPKQVVAKETVKPAVEVSRKPPTASEVLQRGCDAGSFDACHNLAAEYARGLIVAKDEEKSFALDTKACEGGVAPACTNIGRAYQSGRGVTRNLVLARAMFEKACEGGGMIGCVDGGGMLMRGLGGPADPKRAAAWFQRACDAGTVAGCGSLAMAYARGDGVDKDERRAVDMFQRACDAGGAPACNGLAGMYSTGRGVEKDLARAAALLERSCAGNYADACHMLSQRYEQGLGVARDAARAADFEQRATKLRAKSQ